MSRRTFGCALGLAPAMWLAGCAAPTIASSSTERQWSGRFSLVLQADPPQSWSAGFDLSGTPQVGQLQLSSPLGNQLAVVRWSPDGAEMQQGSQRSRHASLEQLATDLGEAPLPVAALFSWLEGQPAPASGWEADLSRFAEGRIVAWRRQPLPAAELRLIFHP